MGVSGREKLSREDGYFPGEGKSGAIHRPHTRVAVSRINWFRHDETTEAGYEAVPTSIEGRLGWARAMGDEPVLAEVTEGLGDRYELLRGEAGIGRGREFLSGSTGLDWSP
jgi:hypothetical protein